jgi:alpha-tubulin suppressor-like RCC1 family protein
MNHPYRVMTTGLAVCSLTALAACGSDSSEKNHPTEAATATLWELPPEFTHTLSATLTFTASPDVSPTPTPPAGLQAAPAAAPIAAGWSHTCAVTGEGGVMCWGYNGDGQLGDGSRTARLKPVSVKNLSERAVAVTAGWGHTCILTETGGVKCWGRNKNGELGNGTTDRSGEPVDVIGLAEGVVAIAAGDDHTCAVTGEGGVVCWGYNDAGQLGDGSTETWMEPVDVEGLEGVTAVAAGTAHTCARTDGGEVFCWGINDQGQLGIDSDEAFFDTPELVSELTGGITAITAKGGHTCSLSESGEIQCWGVNTFGQLGDETYENRYYPSPVNGLDGSVSLIAAGWGQTCAVLEGGVLTCWGWNFYGQLGTGSTANRNHPVDVIGLHGKVTTVAGGGGHTCAIMEAGEVFCWGLNENGQLGNQKNLDSSLPVKVIGISIPGVA